MVLMGTAGKTASGDKLAMHNVAAGLLTGKIELDGIQLVQVCGVDRRVDKDARTVFQLG